MSVTIQVKVDTDELDKLLDRLAELAELSVVVGVVGPTSGASYASGESTATVGLFLEFGTKDMQARPFLRHTISTREQDFARAWAGATSRVVAGTSQPADALADVGQAISAMIVQTIDSAESWAPSPASGGTPLNDTGLLRASIGWAVRKGSQTLREGSAG